MSRIAIAVVTGLLAFCFLSAAMETRAQAIHGGARSLAVGSAVTALDAQLSAWQNPASPAGLSQVTASFQAAQRFGIPDLLASGLALALPTRQGTLTLTGATFGLPSYREISLGSGFGRTMTFPEGILLRLGASVVHHRLSISGYGSRGATGVSAGALVLKDPLVVGFRADNVAGDRKLPRSLALGISFRPSPPALLLADFSKDLRHPPKLHAGVEIRPGESLVLRSGFGSSLLLQMPLSAHSTFSTGTGLILGDLTIDLAAERHEVLGWSPAVSIGLSW
jgi:hypothetical protein